MYWKTSGIEILQMTMQTRKSRSLTKIRNVTIIIGIKSMLTATGTQHTRSFS